MPPREGSGAVSNQRPSDRLRPPLYLSDALTATTRQATGERPEMVPLVLALEWAAAHGAAVRQPRDGLELFRAFMDAVGRQCHERPPDADGP